MSNENRDLAVSKDKYKENTKLLVLDEATSALDSDTARLINNSIVNLATNGYTILMVSHSKSTLKICSDFINIDSFRFKN